MAAASQTNTLTALLFGRALAGLAAGGYLTTAQGLAFLPLSRLPHAFLTKLSTEREGLSKEHAVITYLKNFASEPSSLAFGRIH